MSGVSFVVHYLMLRCCLWVLPSCRGVICEWLAFCGRCSAVISFSVFDILVQFSHFDANLVFFVVSFSGALRRCCLLELFLMEFIVSGLIFLSMSIFHFCCLVLSSTLASIFLQDRCLHAVFIKKNKINKRFRIAILGCAWVLI